MIRVGVVLVTLVTLNCSAPRNARPALLAPRVCPDGAPVRWLQHPSCGQVCGYSCMPDRWRPAPGETNDGRD